MTLDLQSIMDALRHPLARYYVSVVLVALPCLRIFRRTGIGFWPAAFLAIPYIGYIFSAAALVAIKWPRLAPRGGRA